MDERSEQLQLANDVSAPRVARSFVSQTLNEWGHPTPTLDELRLLVSELVSNAVLHGDGAIEIAVSEVDGDGDGDGDADSVRDDGRAGAPGLVRVEVRNVGHGTPVMRRAAREALSGRGLRLVDELAHRWGAHSSDGHTLVWFEVDPRRG